MLAYDRARKAEGLRQIWREEIKAITPEAGPIDPDEEADLVIYEMLEQYYRKSGTVYHRGEFLRRALGYRRPPLP